MSIREKLPTVLTLIAVLGAIFAIGCDTKRLAAADPSGAQVTFRDSNMEAAVRETLGIPERPIYKSELGSLVVLKAMDKHISDLTGIEYCTNLQVLALAENKISDISLLSGLADLRLLYLDGNNISDISPLAGLTNLRLLYLNENNIADITALVTNPGLTTGDVVLLKNNPLNATSLNISIPRLRDKGVRLATFWCGN